MQTQDQKTPLAAPGGEFSQFLKQAATAFAYPLRGRGKYVILGMGIFCAGMQWMRYVSGGMAWGTSMILGMALMLLLVMYLMEIIGSSAGCDDVPPGWPDFSDNLVGSVLLVLGVVVVSFFPSIAVSMARKIGFSSPPWLQPVCIVFALVYLPMGLLRMALTDHVGGMNPLAVIWSIYRVAPAYVIMLFAMGLVVFFAKLLFGYIPHIPILGAAVGEALMMYFLMVLARLTGTIYRVYACRLDWFPGD